MPEMKIKVKQQYRELIKDYRPDSGDLLAALHSIQHHFGYIPIDAVPEVAKQLGMTAPAVFGAITFYAEFRTTPPPKLQVQWCSGPACRLKGGDNIRRVLETTLGLSIEESTPDGRVGMHLQQCDGSCEYAPLVWLRRYDQHDQGEDATLTDERGEIRGPLTVADAVRMGRRLKAGEMDV